MTTPFEIDEGRFRLTLGILIGLASLSGLLALLTL
jgi:hypothetical protein